MAIGLTNNSGGGDLLAGNRSVEIPLSTDLTVVRGTGPATFTSPAATVDDYNSDTWTTQANEIRFPGLQRIENICPNIASVSWTEHASFDGTTNTGGSKHGFDSIISTPTAFQAYRTITLFSGVSVDGKTYHAGVYVRGIGATRYGSSNDYEITVEIRSVTDTTGRSKPAAILTDEWQLVWVQFTGSAGQEGLTLTVANNSANFIGESFEIGDAFIYDVTGITTDLFTPKYIASESDYGAGVNGVKYLAEKANTRLWQIHGDSFAVRLMTSSQVIERTMGVRNGDITSHAVNSTSMTTVKNTYLANLPSATDFVLIWEAYPEDSYADTVTAFDIIATSLNSIGCRWLICSQHPYSTTSAGDTKYDQIYDFNAYLLANHPDNYVDTLSATIAEGYLIGTAQDIIDSDNGVSPDSLRADTIHHNAHGDAICMRAVEEKMLANGWHRDSSGEALTSSGAYIEYTTAVDGHVIRVPSENFPAGDKVIYFEYNMPNWVGTDPAFGLFSYATASSSITVIMSASLDRIAIVPFGGTQINHSYAVQGTEFRCAIVIDTTAMTCTAHINGEQAVTTSTITVDEAASADAYLGNTSSLYDADQYIKNFRVFTDVKTTDFWNWYTSAGYEE